MSDLNNARDEFKNSPEKKVKKEKIEKNSKKNKLIDAINYLISVYDFRYNLVLTETEYKYKSGKEWQMFDDKAFHSIKLDLDMSGFDISELSYRNIIFSERIAFNYDPFKDYFASLPAWDGVDRFPEFMSQIKLSDESKRDYLIYAFKKWFVAMTGCLVDDFTVNHTCFVIVGAQGRFKTTFLNNLVPKEFQLDYTYSSNFDTHNKDHELYLVSKWLINLEEMGVLNRNEIEGIKAKFTQRFVTLRKAYGKANIRAYRRASFVGSSNKDQFLNDMTGSRRFLTFNINDIELSDFNVDLLYAQALSLFKTGFQFWFDKEDIEMVETHNEYFQDQQMEEELMLRYFRKPFDNDFVSRIDYLNATDIMNHITGIHEKINANNTFRRNIGLALKKYGFERVSMYRNGSRLYCYKVVTIPKENVITSDSNSPPPESIMPF